MIISVWEVYKRDSSDVIIFIDQQSALNQLFFPEVDFIANSEVYLSEQEYSELLKTGYIRGK